MALLLSPSTDTLSVEVNTLQGTSQNSLQQHTTTSLLHLLTHTSDFQLAFKLNKKKQHISESEAHSLLELQDNTCILIFGFSSIAAFSLYHVKQLNQ